MPLHAGQVKFLNEAIEKTNVLVPANRWGKTTVISVKHIHCNFYKKGIGRGNQKAWERASYTTVNLSPHSDTTRPVFETIIQILTSSFTINEGNGKIRNNECLIGWFLDQKHIRNTNPLYIPYSNNADTLFRSTGEDQGKSIEGRSYGYISYDEGGQSNHLEYERTRRILPRLGELNGPVDIVSTPELTSASILDHYDLFHKGGGEGYKRQEGFYSQEGSILENHFFLNSNPTYVKDMKAQMKGDPIFEQIVYGKFVFAGDRLFPADEVLAAKDDELTVGKRYTQGHTYVVGIDTAMGEDEMVYTVIDTTNSVIEVVRVIGAKGGSKSPGIHMDDLIALVATYNIDNNVKIILETWNGESARFYLDLPPMLQRITRCFGSWQPPGFKDLNRGGKMTKKADILIALRKLLAQKLIRLPNEPTLINQLSIYREEDTKLKTDRVMSLALACWLATDGKPKNPVLVLESVNW